MPLLVEGAAAEGARRSGDRLLLSGPALALRRVRRGVEEPFYLVDGGSGQR